MQQSTKNDIMVSFHGHVVDFLGELAEQFPSEVDLAIAKMFIKNHINPIVIIERFIKEALPHKNDFKNRNEHILIEKANTIFGNDQKVDRFKKLWLSNLLDDDDRNVIWEWFDTFLILAERYTQGK